MTMPPLPSFEEWRASPDDAFARWDRDARCYALIWPGIAAAALTALAMAFVVAVVLGLMN